jgi:hypothetical protein
VIKELVCYIQVHVVKKYIYICIYVCIFIYINMYVCIFIYIHIYTYVFESARVLYSDSGGTEASLVKMICETWCSGVEGCRSAEGAGGCLSPAAVAY